MTQATSARLPVGTQKDRASSELQSNSAAWPQRSQRLRTRTTSCRQTAHTKKDQHKHGPTQSSDATDAANAHSKEYEKIFSNRACIQNVRQSTCFEFRCCHNLSFAPLWAEADVGKGGGWLIVRRCYTDVSAAYTLSVQFEVTNRCEFVWNTSAGFFFVRSRPSRAMFADFMQ